MADSVPAYPGRQWSWGPTRRTQAADL